MEKLFPSEAFGLRRLIRLGVLLLALQLLGGELHPISADAPESPWMTDQASVSPYAILELIATPDVMYQEHPSKVTYEVRVGSATGEPVEIIAAKAQVMTRPERAHPDLVLDLSELEGQTLFPSEAVKLTSEILYGADFEDAVVTQVITLKLAVKGKEGTQYRVVNSRSEVVFGEPGPAGRGCWPASGYVAALEKYPNEKYHNVWQTEYMGATGTAVDIRAPKGTPIFSPFAGTACTLCSYISPSYGNQVTLTTTEGVNVSFAHLSKYWDGSTTAGLLKTVKPGDLLGFVGADGSGAEYSHLHYEVHGLGLDKGQGNYLRIQDILPEPRPYIGLKTDSGQCTK